MKIILILLIFLNISYSCTKDKVPHPVVGNYNCLVTHTYQDITGNYSSSTYNDVFSVTQEGDSVNVSNHKLHVNDVEYGKNYFFGFSFNQFNFRFEVDSIFISTFTGGLGGGTSTYWIGGKN